MNIIYLVATALLLWTLLFFSIIQVHHGRHQRNIQKSIRIIALVNSFSGAGYEARTLAYLRKIDPYVFEEVILTALQNIGMHITRNKRYSADGGIDGRGHFHHHRFMVQAKRYNQHIKAQDVERFVQTLPANYSGLFVHTGRTGALARQYRCPRLIFVSGHKLVSLVRSTLTPEQLLAGTVDVTASSRRYPSSRDAEPVTVSETGAKYN